MAKKRRASEGEEEDDEQEGGNAGSDQGSAPATPECTLLFSFHYQIDQQALFEMTLILCTLLSQQRLARQPRQHQIMYHQIRLSLMPNAKGLLVEQAEISLAMRCRPFAKGARLRTAMIPQIGQHNSLLDTR